MSHYYIWFRSLQINECYWFLNTEIERCWQQWFREIKLDRKHTRLNLFLFHPGNVRRYLSNTFSLYNLLMQLNTQIKFVRCFCFRIEKFCSNIVGFFSLSGGFTPCRHLQGENIQLYNIDSDLRLIRWLQWENRNLRACIWPNLLYSCPPGHLCCRSTGWVKSL